MSASEFHGAESKSGDALVSGLFAKLPKNGSEIVVFDVNRASPLELLLSQETLARIDNMLPAGPHDYRITVIGNVPGQPRVGESSRAPGEDRPQLRELDLEYPQRLAQLGAVAAHLGLGEGLENEHVERQHLSRELRAVGTHARHQLRDDPAASQQRLESGVVAGFG